jgi:hypothetical protein
VGKGSEAAGWAGVGWVEGGTGRAAAEEEEEGWARVAAGCAWDGVLC